MASTELKKRLGHLRNITEDLKKSTTSPSNNLAHIKTLLTNLKELSQHLPPEPEASKYQPNSNSVQNSHSSDFYGEYQDGRKVGSTKQQKFHEEEIISLREENLRLEEKIGILREEVGRLERKQEDKDHSKNSLPCFQQKEDLKIFACRFQISENEFSKVQYSTQTVELQLDKVVLYQSDRATFEQFDLTTLKQVKYLHSNAMLFRFQEFIKPSYSPLSLGKQDNRQQNSELTSVFIKYDSIDHLKKWDLSIFANFQIVTSLRGSKLFENYFRRLMLQDSLREEREMLLEVQESRQLSLIQQKCLLQLFRKRKEDFIEIKTLIQEKLDLKKQNHNEAIEPLSSGFGQDLKNISNLSSQKDPFIPQPSPQHIDQNEEKQSIPYFSKQVSPEGPSYRNQTVEVRPEQLENRAHTISFSKQQALEAMASSKATVGQNNQSALGQSNELNSTGRGFRSNSQQQQMKKLSVVQQKVNLARKSLQTGFQATKYSKDGFSPHEKKIFLSLDCKRLCWSERDKPSQYKSIPLEVIVKVEYGVIGEGIAKHLKYADIGCCCVIEYYSGQYKKKTIELKGQSASEIKTFAEYLKIFLDYSKGISMNALIDP